MIIIIIRRINNNNNNSNSNNYNNNNHNNDNNNNNNDNDNNWKGGKDSLVAWHIARTNGQDPVLMYVADGESEYEDNWRLNEIVKTIGKGISLGNFLFFLFYFVFLFFYFFTCQFFFVAFWSQAFSFRIRLFSFFVHFCFFILELQVALAVVWQLKF